jgi:signal transduction histidine kinase
LHWSVYVFLALGLALAAGTALGVRHFRASMRYHAALRLEEAKRAVDGRRHAEARYTLEKIRGMEAERPAGAARLAELRTILERAENPRIAPFPVSGPCAEVIDAFRAVAGERELLYSESGDGRWLQVAGERDLLKWAVQEIFRNVDEHAESWTRITVKAEPVEGAVLLTIRDDGVGLDRSATARIYTAFSPRLESKGPGLGLYVVRHIVEGFGGRVEARSAPGGGLLHSLWIPYPEGGPYPSRGEAARLAPH